MLFYSSAQTAAAEKGRLACLRQLRVSIAEQPPHRRDRDAQMTEKPVDLDQHRGMAAQKATDLRRLLTEVAANQQALRVTQDQLEAQLIAAPATTWEEVADKVRYLLSVFGATPTGQDPRRQTLINAVLDDFNRLSRK
jgi:hypothetical protein